MRTGGTRGKPSFFASERVGPSGHVYITELEAKKLDHLKADVRKRALQNITIINADAVGTNLAVKGGLRAWKKGGFPLETVPADDIVLLPTFS